MSWIKLTNIKGPKGQDGKDGVSITGERGPRGFDGIQGVPGKDGKDGARGIKGADGNYIYYSVRIPKADLGQDGDWCFCETEEIFRKVKGNWKFYRAIRTDGNKGGGGGGGGGTANSPLTTKGDLWTYSTLDTRLGAGADGLVLAADSTEATGLKWVAQSGGVTDHTLLSNIGTTSHADIDLHIADGTIHFTQGAIAIAASQVTSGTFADGRIAASNVTQHVGAIDHNSLLNYSANNHVPALTAGSVVYHNGTILSQDNDTFFWDSTNKRLGIGVGASENTVTINGITFGNTLSIHAEGAADLGNFSIHRHSAVGIVSANMQLIRSRGTEAAETILSSGDRIGGIFASGHNGVDYSDSSAIVFEVDGAPGNNDMPGRIIFYTSPDGTETLTEALRISSAQVVNFVNQPTGISFAGLSDVTLTSAANGDTLRYNSSTSRWNNSTRLKVTDQVAIEPATPAATFPYAIVADHSGTNLIVNPSFEVNITDGWTLVGASTNTRDTTEKWIGSASLKMVSGGAVDRGIKTATITVTSNTTYVFSFYVKGAVGGEGLKLTVDQNVTADIGNFTGFTASLGVATLINTEWSRYTYAFTTGATDTSLTIAITSLSATAQTVYIDAVQFEARSFPTDTNEVAFASTYMDGSMGDGYAWTGTAHNSTSTRTAGTKFLAPISATNNRGGFVMRTDGTIARFLADAKEIQIGEIVGLRNEPNFPFTFTGNMKTNVNTSGILAGIMNVRNSGNGTALHVESAATTSEGFIVSAAAVTSGSCMAVFAPTNLDTFVANNGKFFTFSGKAQNADMYSFYGDRMTIGQLGFIYDKNINVYGGGQQTATVRAIAGTVSVTNALATVTGTGFLTNFKRGQSIEITNGAAPFIAYTIASIESDTSLTLTANYAGTTNAARTYQGRALQYKPPTLSLEGAYANHGTGLVGDFMYSLYASGGAGQLHCFRSAARGVVVTPTADHTGHGLVTARQVSVNSGLIFGVATETTMISGYTILANELTPGGAFRISFIGAAVIDNSVRTLTWRVKLGTPGTTILTSTAVQVGVVGTVVFRGVIEIFAPTTTTQICSLSIVGKDQAAVTPGLTYSVSNLTTTGTVDMRVDQALTVTCQADLAGQVITVSGVTTVIN